MVAPFRRNVACAQPPRIVRAEQRTAILLKFNAFSEEMALKVKTIFPETLRTY